MHAATEHRAAQPAAGADPLGHAHGPERGSLARCVAAHCRAGSSAAHRWTDEAEWVVGMNAISHGVKVIILMMPLGCSGSVLVDADGSPGESEPELHESACRAISSLTDCCSYEESAADGSTRSPCNWVGPVQAEGESRCIRRRDEDCSTADFQCPEGTACVVAEQGCDYTSYAIVDIGVCM